MGAITSLCASLILFTHFSYTQPGWQLLPGSPNANGRHDDIYFLHPDLGWVVNGQGQVHRTTDGGQTWIHQATVGYARCVGFIDSLNGWIGTRGGSALLVTSDGGFTWNSVEDISGPPAEQICGISVVNDSVVFASGAYYATPRVLKTTDRGTHWYSFALDSIAGALVDCRFTTPDSGIVVGSTIAPVCSISCSPYGRALIISTGDGGNTWKVNHTGAREDELCWKISFPSKQTGFVSIEDFSTPGPVYFLKTVDGGMSWEEKIFLPNWRDEQGIGFVTEKLGWIGGWSGETYETTDGGDTWYQAGPGRNVNRFRFFGDTLGYATGQRVHKYTTDSSTVAVEDEEHSVSMAYELHQNFPNPFNPSTSWRFSLPDMARVRLLIVDVLGKEIAVILDGVWSAGTHLAHWDGRNSMGQDVPSGVYFYRMQTADRTLTRKLMLVR